ncbi:MAG: 50S ribosomal protein L9 [Dehalococcoidia bacterium]
MKVVFLTDVAGTADAGEVKEVKNGFARNFLLPQGLAAPATPNQLQRIHAIEKAAQETRLQFSTEWSDVAKIVEGMNIPIEVRVGPTGRLFGSVTGRQIAEKLTEATGRDIDHRQVLLGAAIHEPGDFPVTVRLYREVQAEVIVSVIPEGYTAEEAAALAALGDEAKAFFAEADAASPEATAEGEAAEGESAEGGETASEAAGDAETKEQPAEEAPEEVTSEATSEDSSLTKRPKTTRKKT